MTDQNEEKASGLSVHEPSLPPPGKKENTVCEAPDKRRRRGFFPVLTFLIAVAALFFALSERFAPDSQAIGGMNQMITDQVVPEMKRSRERDLIDSLYELKHISVTLEKLKESSKNPEVKAQVDQLRKQIEDLSVKMFVHE